MTNNNLRADLISEIEAMENFFHDLPYDVRDRYLLDDRPVTVRFGPDVETVFVDEDGNNALRLQNDLEKRNLLSQLLQGNVSDAELTAASLNREYSVLQGVRSSLSIQKIRVKNDVNTDPDKFVEMRFKPNSALDVCEHLEHAEAVLNDIARDNGLYAYGISSHLHRSIGQGGGDLLRADPRDKDSFVSRLLKNSIAQTVSMQERFPAFYVRPFRAEQEDKSKRVYSGPRWFCYDKESACASVRVKHVMETYLTSESRVNPDDPYQAVYLDLKSISDTLNDNLNLTATGRDLLGLSDLEWGGQKTFDELVSEKQFSPSPVRRGAGGYLNMLEETARNLDEHPDVFPKHISDGMMRASIEGYDRYFDENPKAKPDEIDNLRERISALKAQFPEPVEDTPRKDYVVT